MYLLVTRHVLATFVLGMFHNNTVSFSFVRLEEAIRSGRSIGEVALFATLVAFQSNEKVMVGAVDGIIHNSIVL